MKITLTEVSEDKRHNIIEIEVNDIRRYAGTDFPLKDSTWIEMNSGTEFRVKENFDTVDDMVENFKD